MKKLLVGLLAFTGIGAFAQTAVTNFPITNVPLSTLTAAGSISGSDIFYSVVGGNSRKVTADTMKVFMTNGVGGEVSTAQMNTLSNQLRTGNLILLATFNQTNGVGSNVLAGARPRVGVFRHATGVGGVAPNGLIPAITNNSLTYSAISNAGTIYICYGAEGTNAIRRVRMLFRYNQVNGTGTAVSTFAHLAGNGEYVASADLLTHGGFGTTSSTVSYDAHLGGFGSFTYGPVSATNNSATFPLINQILEPIIGLGSVGVYEYWLDGSNILGHVNGWGFSMPYTNGAAFGASTNLIVQFFAPAGNALTGRAPEILEIAAWDTPYPGLDNQSQYVPSVGGYVWDLALRGNITNMPGARFIGTGSNSVEGVTTGSFTNLNVVGVLNLNNDSVVGTYTNNGTNVGGVFTNAVLAGTVSNSPGTTITGFGNNWITNITGIGTTNLTVNGGNIGGPSFINLNVANIQKLGVGGSFNISYQRFDPSGYGFDLGAANTPWQNIHGTNIFAQGRVTSSNGVYYPSNSFTAATVIANLTNGGFWQGTISNALHAAWMTNGTVLWKIIAP